MNIRVKVRRAGGSLIVALPPSVAEMLQVQEKSELVFSKSKRGVEIQRPKPKYTLEQLLAQCNPRARRSREESEWLNSPPAGKELV